MSRRDSAPLWGALFAAWLLFDPLRALADPTPTVKPQAGHKDTRTAAKTAPATAATRPKPPSPADPGSENVVVTAERRSESVKDVPISITAISSATIQKFDIQDLQDYAKLAPNLSFGQSVGGGGASFGAGVAGSLGISIRGISGYQTTAFYIDDTPLPDGLDPRILDINHIEVLRGPQGTLFGASSMGGIVRVITNPAVLDQYSGTFDVQGFGVSHGGAPGGSASGVVNVPLVRDLASVRLSAFEDYTPGFFTRTYNDPQALNVTGQPVIGPAGSIGNVGAKQDHGVGATFLLTPLRGLMVTPLIRWQRTDGAGFPLADYDPNSLVQRRIVNQPESYFDSFFFAALTGSYTVPFGRFVSSTSWFNRISYDLEDGADANSEALSPTSLLPAPGIGYIHTKALTEEDRFESKFRFPVQFVSGLFYQIENTSYYNNITQPGLDTEADSPFDTDDVFTLLTHQRTTQLAGFLGVTYTPIKRLEISVGGRESRLTNSVDSDQTGIFGTGPAHTDVSENSFTPRFSAKYRFNPQWLVYATAAEGFRVGGANPPLGSACSGFGFNTSSQIPYGSDNLWSYEVGVKASGLDNRVSVNVDAYHIDWRHIQQSEVLSNGANDCFAALTLNLGTATSDGGELEASARVTENLSVHLAAGYEDAHLTEASAGTEYHVGEPLSGVPKWTANASADYEIPRSWGNYFVRGEYSYTGSSLSYSELASGLLRKSYQLVDLRGGVTFQRFTLSLFSRNLFDARPNLGDEVAVTALAANRYRFLVGLPREIGVDLRYRF